MSKQIMKDLRIQRSAIDAFQETVEEFLVRTFESKLIVFIVCLICSLISIFNDELANNSCEKSHYSDEEYAIIE
jgi:hypothetical protein